MARIAILSVLIGLALFRADPVPEGNPGHVGIVDYDGEYVVDEAETGIFKCGGTTRASCHR